MTATSKQTGAPVQKRRSEEAAGVLLIRLIVLALLLGWVARSWADPDLWGHVRFGGDIVRSGIPFTDPYSFTSDIPWINHEWLAEVLMYLAWAAGGGAGLIALKMIIVGGTLALVIDSIRREPAPPISDLLVFAALVGLWSRVFVVRPQLFSIVLFAALLWIFKSAESGKARRLWLLPILFLFWANLHGGWIVGMGVLLLWAAIGFTPFATAPLPRGVLAAAVAASLAAALVNPYGFGLWRFLAETVRPSRPDVSDWRPLAETDAQVLVPWAITAVVTAIALVRSRLRIPLAPLLIVVGLGISSIKVNRLDVFFTLSLVMLFARYFGGADGQAVPAWTTRTKGVAAAIAIVLAVLAWRAQPQITCLRLDGPWMPERESGAFIAANTLGGRLLTWFDWGQYAIWHFAPRLKVSLDGRRETVYSDGFVSQHLRLYFNPDSALDVLERFQADYAWLPVNLQLTHTLDRLGWHRLYTGPVSVVFSRQPATAPAAPVVAARACFPGP
jgi:hypothetical protein